MNHLKKWLSHMRKEGVLSSRDLKRRQSLLIFGGVVGMMGVGLLLLPGSSENKKSVDEKKTDLSCAQA